MIPPYGRQHRPLPDTAEFAFRFDRAARPLLALLGVGPTTSGVSVDADRLEVRFGLGRVRTPSTNVVAAEESGPFRAWRALGPRLSLADRGLTFGTSVRGGVCVTFAEPVRGPFGLSHPSLTVTVEHPADLVATLALHRGLDAGAVDAAAETPGQGAGRTRPLGEPAGDHE